MEGGPLPGQSLVGLDPQSKLVVDVFPGEDADTQERALLNRVLKTVVAQDLWIGERNLCTRSFLIGIAVPKACFVIRQHQQIPLTAQSELCCIGNSPTGKVFEQPVVIIDEDENEWHLRRVVVQLHQPTQDGDTQVAVLTNLPDTDADATVVSELYLGRWTIEGLFQVVTDQFACEIKTLGYPRAALFSFCMALLAYNLLAKSANCLG